MDKKTENGIDRSDTKKRRKKLNITPVIVSAAVITLAAVCVALAILSMLIPDPTEIIGCLITITLVLAVTSVVTGMYAASATAIDPLTRLLNIDRFILYTLFLVVRKKHSDYSAVYINLKDFKYINRIVGSPGGDSALAKFSAELLGFASKGEYSCRLGGDNFIILIRKDRVDEFLTLLDEMEVDIETESGTKTVTVSSRCGIYPIKSEDTISDILNNSSTALNHAKLYGTADYTYFTDDMLTALYEEKDITYHFYEAIENEEFVIYYQPKVDTSENRLCGAEALVRWVRNGEIIPPSQFIPILEKSGLLPQLDMYVLEHVCLDLKRWEAHRLPLIPISSNFSKLHLRDEKFCEKVLSVIHEHNVDPDLFEVELTESSGHDDFIPLKNFIASMTRAGIRTSIDDFGIGYSSLELLRDMNINTIKIDKNFVDGIEMHNGENPDFLLTSNILRMCLDMKKDIVIEGVETEGQLRLLSQLNCRVIQGFLFDKPLPRDEFEKRLTNPVYTVEK